MRLAALLVRTSGHSPLLSQHIIRKMFIFCTLFLLSLVFILFLGFITRFIAPLILSQIDVKEIFKILSFLMIDVALFVGPLSLLLAFLWMIRSLHIHDEWLVMQSMGLGPFFLFQRAFFVSSFFSLILLWMSLNAWPRMNHYFADVERKAFRYLNFNKLSIPAQKFWKMGPAMLWYEKGHDGVFMKSVLSCDTDDLLMQMSSEKTSLELMNQDNIKVQAHHAWIHIQSPLYPWVLFHCVSLDAKIHMGEMPIPLNLYMQHRRPIAELWALAQNPLNPFHRTRRADVHLRFVLPLMGITLVCIGFALCCGARHLDYSLRQHLLIPLSVGGVYKAMCLTIMPELVNGSWGMIGGFYVIVVSPVAVCLALMWRQTRAAKSIVALSQPFYYVE